MWASGLRTAVLPAQEADWQQDLYVGQSLFTWGSPSGGPWPSECGGPQNRRWPPKADVYADSDGSPQKTPAQSRPRKTRHTGRRPSGIPWAHSLELFALVLGFYREFSQLMDDCTGRQSAHKLRALKPHPRHSQDFYSMLKYVSKIKGLFTISFLVNELPCLSMTPPENYY